ncbi:hypothetical protein GCM10022626_08980 [[Pseudomonas] carboxydohydrogena]
MNALPWQAKFLNTDDPSHQQIIPYRVGAIWREYSQPPMGSALLANQAFEEIADEAKGIAQAEGVSPKQEWAT